MIPIDTIENLKNEIERGFLNPTSDNIDQENIIDFLNKSLKENYKLYSPPEKPFIQDIGREKEIE